MKELRCAKWIFSAVFSVALGLMSAIGQDLDTSKGAIDDFVKQAELKFQSSKAGFVLKSKLAETFSYSMKGNDVEVLSVRYRNADSDHDEEYFFQAGKLVYATERQAPVGGGGPDWSGVYYFKNGKLLDHATNGHGKSELDSWDPEDEVFRMSRKRMKQLRDHLKKRNLR
jgi:hypothetical protein